MRVMIYDKRRQSPLHPDGAWHCPFTPEWVAKMRHAVAVCRNMVKDEQQDSGYEENFLSQPQDSRGLPVDYDDNLNSDVRLDTWDYRTIPEVVITNGKEDWPLQYRFGVKHA